MLRDWGRIELDHTFGNPDVSFFGLNFAYSPGRINLLLSDLQNAKGDLQSTKRLLAKALLDSIVDRNQLSFSNATNYYFRTKKALE